MALEKSLQAHWKGNGMTFSITVTALGGRFGDIYVLSYIDAWCGSQI